MVRVLFRLLLLTCVAAGARVTVTPAEDPDVLLHNPDMGWVLYENYPLDQRPGGSSTFMSVPNEDFAGVDHVAIMFAWSDVEKSADAYDFSKVDYAYDYWSKRGKQIQLRMSTETLLWWNKYDPPTGLGVPKYVLDRIPAATKQMRVMEGFEYAVVDAREPYYLERLAKFLAAVANHYDAKRPVTLVDLRGFGVWGEWHQGYRYATPAERRAALCGIIDVWSKAFPNHWLSLSYSHDPDGPADYFSGPTDKYDPAFTKSYPDFVRYSAFDQALTKPNVSLRRDGVGGAVYSNQRKLCDEAFNRLDRGPMMCEFHSGYAENRVGGEKWLQFKIDDALSLHPNYINLLGYQCGDALNFMKEQPGLFTKGLRNMGYRLVPTSVTYPKTIRAGEVFNIEMNWVNRAVGRAMRDYRLRLRVGDETINAGALETSKWIKGKTYPTTNRATFDSVNPGTYPLKIELIDPQTDKSIALPLKTNEIGEIEVQ